MSNEILIALFSLLGTLVGSGGGILVSNKLVNYRLDQLEKKVDKYCEKEDEVIKELAVKFGVSVIQYHRFAYHSLLPLCSIIRLSCRLNFQPPLY